MIMMELKPLSSMQAYLKQHTLEEAEDILPPLDMVKTIVSDFKVILTLCHTLIIECEQSNDFVTADLLIKIKSVLDKHVWILRAMLK
jgi:starvation-inducible DNA-binding protein